MDSDEVKYLRKRYHESSSSDKRVKFSDIQQDLVTRFPKKSWNSRIISETVRAAFPNSTSKQQGKSRSTFVHGIEESIAASSQDTCTPDHSVKVLKESLEVEKKRNGELLMYIQQLEKQNAELVRAQSTAFWPEVIENQVAKLMNPAHCVHHGPDTLDHMEKFSLDAIITEIRAHAPDVFRLINVIGGSDRLADSDITQVTQLRSVSSLLTLLKCRSVKVLGVQLLLTFMLIARATSRQVNTSNNKSA